MSNPTTLHFLTRPLQLPRHLEIDMISRFTVPVDHAVALKAVQTVRYAICATPRQRCVRPELP